MTPSLQQSHSVPRRLLYYMIQQKPFWKYTRRKLTHLRHQFVTSSFNFDIRLLPAIYCKRVHSAENQGRCPQQNTKLSCRDGVSTSHSTLVPPLPATPWSVRTPPRVPNPTYPTTDLPLVSLHSTSISFHPLACLRLVKTKDFIQMQDFICYSISLAWQGINYVHVTYVFCFWDVDNVITFIILV